MVFSIGRGLERFVVCQQSVDRVEQFMTYREACKLVGCLSVCCLSVCTSG